MKPPNLELRIEELVVHGLPHLDRAQLDTIIQNELTRLFTAEGVPSALHQTNTVASLNTDAFTMQPNTSVEAVGSQIAQAVYGGLGR